METSRITLLAIEGELCVGTAEGLRERLLSAFETAGAGDVVRLALDRVDEVDGAGLQLLIAAKHEARQRRIELQLDGHPPALLALLELTDLGRWFGDPVVIDSEVSP